MAPLAIESMLNNPLDCGGRKRRNSSEWATAVSKNGAAQSVPGYTIPLETAVRWGLLPANPMERVVLPKAEKKEIRALDKQGLSQLLGAVSGTSLFPLFVIAVATGCRRGELLALEWQDIDFQTGMVTISKSLEATSVRWIGQRGTTAT